MIETETIRRDVEPGASLARNGLFVFGIKGRYENDYRWECQIKMLHPQNREIAKRLIEVWLTSQYVASGIYFFKRNSDDNDHFRASFVRGDV